MTEPDETFAQSSIEVVLLTRDPDGRVFTLIGRHPVLLSTPPEPDNPDTDALIDALYISSATLTAPSEVPTAVVQQIENAQPPALFLSSPQLARCRALVFEANRCVVGTHVLRYAPGLGVYASDASPSDYPIMTDSTVSEQATGPAAGFDLVSEPWLPVIMLDGTRRPVGLAEILRDAHQIHRLVAETPSMTAALHRLLLAFVHRIYGPPTMQAWTDLWQARALPAAPAHDYWRRRSDRLDLFDRQRPFLQCPALSTVKPSTAAKLVPYRSVGNNVTLFDHTTATDRPTLSPAEAARWLVTLHAFDPGGMKTPYEKDKSSERAPCNHFGVVIVEGASLKETLLLNTLVYDPDYEKPAPISADDRPAWEDPALPSPLPGKRSSLGWTDLLTWSSRRVLLLGNRDGVNGVVITPGDRLDANLPEEEMMAAFWRPLTPRGTPKKDAPLLPLRLYPVRGVWRHSVDLLMIDVREENRTRRRPRTLSHLADLAEYGHIPADAVYTLRVLGQQLDDKGAVVQAWLEDQVPAPVALLRARNDSIATLIGNAITLADDAGYALRSLQKGFRKDRSASAASSIDLGYWPALPAPFAVFLTELGAAYHQRRSEAPVIEDWARQVRQHAQRVADRWAADATRDSTELVILGRHLVLFETRLGDAIRTFRAKANQNIITREPDVHSVHG